MSDIKSQLARNKMKQTEVIITRCVLKCEIRDLEDYLEYLKEEQSELEKIDRRGKLRVVK